VTQLLLVLTCAGLSASLPAGSPLLGGGRDSFGYTWLDSDTAAPGAPAYRWFDIRSCGTRIQGLGDDNVVGPFPLWFEFHYYWYNVNSVLVGSNGYVTFNDNMPAPAPFPRLPNPARPNNLLAPLMSDLDFSGSGNPSNAFYWTNPTLDTFIVEFDSVRFWSTGGCNSFEVILSLPDSSIAFMYRRQSGAPYGGWLPGNASVGMEDVTGTYGSSYLYGNIPSQDSIHDSLAIRFRYPSRPDPNIRDAAVWRVMNEENGAFVRFDRPVVNLWAKVRNCGTGNTYGYPVYCAVRNQADSLVFADTLMTGTQVPGQIDSLGFMPAWIPETTGQYTLKVVTALDNDIWRRNDTVISEVRIIIGIHGELAYDDGLADTGITWWSRPGGFANRFEIEQYLVPEVTFIQACLSSRAPRGCTLGLFAADGSSGSPGTRLADTVIVVSAPAPTWYRYDLPVPVVITAGVFYVGVVSDADTGLRYAMDRTLPMSRQGWEFTGAWQRSRFRDECDAMLRAEVTLLSGLESQDRNPARIGLSVYPNPSSGIVRFQLPRGRFALDRLEILDASGRIVRALPAGGTEVVWDGRTESGTPAPAGIYFLNLTAPGGAETRRLVLLR